MPIVTIYCDTKTIPSDEFVERDLFWHDTIRKELLEFKGGELQMEYREDPYLVSMKEEEREKRGIKSTWRLLPKVVDLKVKNYKQVNKVSNKNKISKFFEDYQNYNITNIIIESEDEDSLELNVPETEIDDFVYQIERNGFRFAIE